ncbi:MAG TPA: hypothetical protein VN941_08755 [Bradyrhizobium sp.]|nr:hypothetical protein [Bradyrhizobium sp.]
MTIPVQVSHILGDFSTPASTTVDPNPVIAELQPAGPAAQGTQDIEAEKAKTKGNGRGTGSIALPRSSASLRAGRAWPLMAWTCNRRRIVCRAHHA